MIKKIIFDLDGTLLDTSEGIFSSIKYTEKKMNLKTASYDSLKSFVGPPLRDSYEREYGLYGEELLRAIEYHKDYGKRKSIFQTRLYPGMQKVLEELYHTGYELFVATLKDHEIAEKMLFYNGISSFFKRILGTDAAENITKTDQVNDIVGADRPEDVVLIGDSKYDYDATTKTGIRFIGVLYGFGFEDGCFYNFPTVNHPNGILKEIL